MADKLYFAYGSNINLEQMDYRCPDATVVGPVVLENYELLFRRGGFATIEPKKGERVHGLLWSITPECERSLDLYEGYPRFYDKQTVTVRDGLGRELPVMASLWMSGSGNRCCLRNPITTAFWRATGRTACRRHL